MLGLNLDFLFGRGYLSARHVSLGGWATVESLRMEIPDLTFPFDARGGTERFRNTRCDVRELRLLISESGLRDLLVDGLSEDLGLEDLKIRFVDGAVHVRVQTRAMGRDTFVSFKLALVPPEPTREDAVEAVFYDVRAFGPLPYPGRLLVVELMQRLLGSTALHPLGTGSTFSITQHGASFELQPLRLALIALFPQHGWKLPSLSGAALETVDIHPGAMAITARGGPPLAATEPRDRTAANVGAEAIAAYEARQILAEADDAMVAGEPAAALNILRGLKERFGLHSAIADALLDGLLSTSAPGAVAEADAVVQQLLRANPDDLRAHVAAPTVALMRGNRTSALDAYEALADLLRRRGETADLATCLTVAATVHGDEDQDAAVRLLKEAVLLDPRDRPALVGLRRIYADRDDAEGSIEVLERLTALTTARTELLDLYRELGELTLQRRGDVEQARVYLRRALELDPTALPVLLALAETHVLGGQPLRAIKVYGAAARAAAQRGEVERAATLNVEAARLWRDLGDASSASVACQRALELAPEHREGLEIAVEIAERTGETERALVLIERLVPLVDHAVEGAENDEDRRRRAEDAHRIHLLAARVADGRGRDDTAASHHRRALAFRPPPATAPTAQRDRSVDYLDVYYRQMGRPEDLVDLYRGELERGGLSDALTASIHRDLAVIYEEGLGLLTEACDHLSRALALDPGSDDARHRAIQLLGAKQRHLELFELLDSIESRVRDRTRHGHVLWEMGRLRLDPLPDPIEAVQLLRRAQRECPTDLEVAEDLVRAEVALVTDHAGHAGDATEALRALERLAEVSPTPRDERAALERAGDFCRDVLADGPRAATYYSRARMVGPPGRSGVPPLPDVKLPAPPSGRDEPNVEASDFGAPLSLLLASDDRGGPPPNTSALAASLGRPPKTTGATPIAGGLGRAWEQLDGGEPVEPAVESGERATSHSDLSQLATLVAGRPAPSSPPVPPAAGSLSTFRSELLASITEPARLESTRALVEELRPVRRPPVAMSRDEAIAKIEDARGDQAELVRTLTEIADETGLETDLRIKVERELGLLLTYDLEDSRGALPHLRTVRDLQANRGETDLDVLTALEGIFEDLDDAEGLLEVYRAKRSASSDPGMIAVYSVLAAELLWERLGHMAEAQALLEQVLEHQPLAEPVLELLARICVATGDTQRAVELLRTLVDSQDPGDYERQQGLRQLGRLLLQRADSLGDGLEAQAARDQAIDVFVELLGEVRGDSEAIEALKRLYEDAGRHADSIRLLGRELRLLIASPDAFAEGPSLTELKAAGYSDALAIPISQIFTDAGRISARSGQLPRAIALFEGALAVWSDNVDAISAKLELLRSVDDPSTYAEPLADSLEEMAALLLDPVERATHLLEAAEIYRTLPGSATRASDLADLVVAMGGDDTIPGSILGAAQAIVSEGWSIDADALADQSTSTQQVPALRLQEKVSRDGDPHGVATREIVANDRLPSPGQWTREELEATASELASSRARAEAIATTEVRSVDGDPINPAKLLTDTRPAIEARRDASADNDDEPSK